MGFNYGDMIGNLSLTLIKEVEDFVNINKNFDSDITLISGRNCIDAKSLMGIFSLSLDKPIDIAFLEKVNGEKDKYINELKNYGFIFIEKK